MHLLDIGSGIGGPARYFARHHGCRVTGIDLTEEFIAVARALTSRLRMEGQVSFEQGSALSMPFPASTFDVATLLHVGMNIAKKAQLFAEVRRVLNRAASPPRTVSGRPAPISRRRISSASACAAFCARRCCIRCCRGGSTAILPATSPAVFEAFKTVEIEVRGAGKYPEKEIGKALMFKAFAPSGPLSRPQDDTGPRAT